MKSQQLSSQRSFYPTEGAKVALIKSLATNNRFYTLAPPDSGIENAGTVREIPHELQLGIAYPCLEDDLNDFAVIRSAFETLELFSNDTQTQTELAEIIQDARGNLTRRLMELLERLIAKKAHFLGTDLSLFKTWTLKLITHGISRYDIDTAMKVNVFSSVAGTEQSRGFNASPRYRYEFHNSETAARLSQLGERDFLVALFSDVLDSVLEEANYRNRYAFDRKIFQQFIALLFVTYAATDPVFYGTHRDDYGVSRERDMENTPLYRAIGTELRRLAGLPPRTAMPVPTEPENGAPAIAAQPQINAANRILGTSEGGSEGGSDDDWDAIALAEISDRAARGEEASLHCRAKDARPQAADDETLLRPIAAICAVAHRLCKSGQSPDLARLIFAESSRLVQELKLQGVLSPLAYDPGAVGPDEQ